MESLILSFQCRTSDEIERESKSESESEIEIEMGEGEEAMNTVWEVCEGLTSFFPGPQFVFSCSAPLDPFLA